MARYDSDEEKKKRKKKKKKRSRSRFVYKINENENDKSIWFSPILCIHFQFSNLHTGDRPNVRQLNNF